MSPSWKCIHGPGPQLLVQLVVDPGERLFRIVEAVVVAPAANACVHVDDHDLYRSGLPFFLPELVDGVPLFVRAHFSNGFTALVEEALYRFPARSYVSPDTPEEGVDGVLSDSELLDVAPKEIESGFLAVHFFHGVGDPRL